jgi:hypothetical protein
MSGRKVYSYFPAPGCIFLFFGSDYHPYIFPLFSLFGKVVNILVGDKVQKAILILPK